MIRKGECKSCGKCCKNIGVFSIYTSPDILDWLKVRGVDNCKTEVLPDNRVVAHILLPSTCPHLIPYGEGKYGCDLHDREDEFGFSLKPHICRLYPQYDNVMGLEDGCGYWFEDEESK